ncbi:cytidylate kinase-like family protein [Marasmitruncus massiliensis]|jgi:cytidylate kinase|uniref:cytidylate kinase-like family protein n=1 Tax=Marasmitruncus massiliensis TaxID=1944642 RepID=UPI003119D3F3
MMDHFVVTIARGYGSGGRTIGRMLAEKLGVPYYDKELLHRAADDSGINVKLFAQSDENLKRPKLFKTGKANYSGEVIPPDSDDFISEENLFNYQAKIIRELAETESCVIVGRCADFILKDYDYVLRIYVHAPMDYCIEKTMEIHANFSREEAERYIHKTDKRRAGYYRYFTGHDWKDADNYDLCINSSMLGWDKCVALVRSYLSIKLSED